MNKKNDILDIKKIRKVSLINIMWQWEIILLFIFIMVVVINSNLSPYFLDYTNLMNTTFNFIEKAIIALPMIFVIICGDIDISVASIIALSSVFMGMASQAGVNTFGLVAIGLFSGMTAGFLNGFIITKFGIPAIAVTLGSMSLFRGIAYLILGDKAFTKYPTSFAFFGQEYIGNTMIPFELVLFFILAIIFGIILHKTTMGRKVFAIGNNSTAARFSGIPVNRIRLIIFTVTGLCSGLASILLTSRIGSTRPNIANGWELEIITTVVLGGVAITGGKGNIFGVVISIFIIGFLKFGMGLINVPGKVMNIIIGLLLILAIMLPELLKRLKPKNSFGYVKQ
ncbi:MAG: ABC transporter permease [Candidatus Atribacteria bacterium]|nr:ABC transporter permease [Candidatus Atribacteria bacterium]